MKNDFYRKNARWEKGPGPAGNASIRFEWENRRTRRGKEKATDDPQSFLKTQVKI